jgi:hypothetical protein
MGIVYFGTTDFYDIDGVKVYLKDIEGHYSPSVDSDTIYFLNEHGALEDLEGRTYCGLGSEPVLWLGTALPYKIYMGGE